MNSVYKYPIRFHSNTQLISAYVRASTLLNIIFYCNRREKKFKLSHLSSPQILAAKEIPCLVRSSRLSAAGLALATLAKALFSSPLPPSMNAPTTLPS